MIIAASLKNRVEPQSLPTHDAWSKATPILFSSDWQGNNTDIGRQTEVRVLWSPETLFLRFRCNFRGLYTFPNGNRRQNKLWTRDVAEAFFQPPEQTGYNYAEFEISPNGDWLDLTIDDQKLRDLNSSMRSRVQVHSKEKIWTAELAIPMTSIARQFDPKLSWRANFFRIEGREPKRFYSSWHPTNTPEPNFHVPGVFGTLIFEE